MQHERLKPLDDGADMDEEHGAFALGIALLADRSDAFSTLLQRIEPWRIHLAYSAIELQRSSLLRDPRALGDAVATWPLKLAASVVFGARLPGLKRALGRIGPFPMRSGAYRLLGRALGCPIRRKLIFHAPQISSGLLNLLDILPSEAISAKILNWDHGDRDMLRRISRAVAEIRANVLEPQLSSAWQSLRELDHTGDLRSWLHDQMLDAVLPPPPWDGNATITPVRTYGEVKRIAQDFRNCLWGQRVDNIAGSSQVYVCRDEGIEAVASVFIDETLGWCLSEIKGVGNRALAPEAVAYLVRQFAAAGIESAIGARQYWVP